MIINLKFWVVIIRENKVMDGDEISIKRKFLG